MRERLRHVDTNNACNRSVGARFFTRFERREHGAMFRDKQCLWRLFSEVIGYLADASGCVLTLERNLVYRWRQGS